MNKLALDDRQVWVGKGLLHRTMGWSAIWEMIPIAQ